MFRSRTAFGVLVGGSALAIGACHDDAPITGPSPGPEIAELRQEAQGVGLVRSWPTPATSRASAASSSTGTASPPST